MSDQRKLASLVFRRRLWLERWNNRDKFYEYSDDFKVYSAGLLQEKSLRSEDLSLRAEEESFGVYTNYTEEKRDDIHR